MKEPMIDSEYLKELTEGDAEFERDLLATFAESAVELIDAARAALATGDAEGLAAAIHTLKGSSRSIGAINFAAQCEEVEAELRSENAQESARAADLLEDAERLRAYCDVNSRRMAA